MIKTVVSVRDLGINDGKHFYTLMNSDEVIERGSLQTLVNKEKGILSLYMGDQERHYNSEVKAEISINSATNEKVGFKIKDGNTKVIVYFMNEK
ncbi:hypothetical protein ESZ50_00710 [Weissella muntiaci]|uniref:Uncharacterized protein n=1 Tax=Weissella muntiaci TaxID=2508881 RepID=A0A6C2CAJ3_9LACO|nr:hypothetical protein [Weissella muntiaci]TYC51088.1 hypothetical protein ESZ50_00710 [Weissella muntiaci]